MSDSIDFFTPLIEPWKDFGTVLKGELKRTVLGVNLLLTLTLGPAMAKADYGKLMKKHRAKINEIDKEVDAALEKVDIPGGFKAAAFIANPGMGLALAANSISGKVTPQNVENFSKEYGFYDLKISRFPIGKLFTYTAKKAAQVGGFATLNQQAIAPSDADQEAAAETKWWTPIERLFLLTNPFKSPVSETRITVENLLLEKKLQNDPEAEALAAFINNHESMQKYFEAVGIPYIKAHEDLITGLVDIFEQEIEDITNISTAQTFDEFADAFSTAKSDKFKKINAQQLKNSMEKAVEDLMSDKEQLTKFLEVLNKSVDEFSNDDKTRKFLTQKIYEKEFAETRANSIKSVEEGLEDIKNEIMGKLDNDDLKYLEGSPIGDQLVEIIENAIQRLDDAAKSIEKLKK